MKHFLQRNEKLFQDEIYEMIKNILNDKEVIVLFRLKDDYVGERLEFQNYIKSNQN